MEPPPLPPSGRFRIRVQVFSPETASSVNASPKHSFLIAKSASLPLANISLRQLCHEVLQRFRAMFPNQPLFAISKSQDSFGSDLYLEDRVGDLFEDNEVFRIVQGASIRESLQPIEFRARSRSQSIQPQSFSNSYHEPATRHTSYHQNSSYFHNPNTEALERSVSHLDPDRPIRSCERETVDILDSQRHHAADGEEIRVAGTQQVLVDETDDESFVVKPLPTRRSKSIPKAQQTVVEDSDIDFVAPKLTPARRSISSTRTRQHPRVIESSEDEDMPDFGAGSKEEDDKEEEEHLTWGIAISPRGQVTLNRTLSPEIQLEPILARKPALQEDSKRKISSMSQQGVSTLETGSPEASPNLSKLKRPNRTIWTPLKSKTPLHRVPIPPINNHESDSEPVMHSRKRQRVSNGLEPFGSGNQAQQAVTEAVEHARRGSSKAPFTQIITPPLEQATFSSIQKTGPEGPDLDEIMDDNEGQSTDDDSECQTVREVMAADQVQELARIRQEELEQKAKDKVSAEAMKIQSLILEEEKKKHDLQKKREGVAETKNMAAKDQNRIPEMKAARYRKSAELAQVGKRLESFHAKNDADSKAKEKQPNSPAAILSTAKAPYKQEPAVNLEKVKTVRQPAETMFDEDRPSPGFRTPQSHVHRSGITKDSSVSSAPSVAREAVRPATSTPTKLHLRQSSTPHIPLGKGKLTPSWSPSALMARSSPKTPPTSVTGFASSSIGSMSEARKVSESATSKKIESTATSTSNGLPSLSQAPPKKLTQTILTPYPPAATSEVKGKGKGKGRAYSVAENRGSIKNPLWSQPSNKVGKPLHTCPQNSNSSTAAISLSSDDEESSNELSNVEKPKDADLRPTECSRGSPVLSERLIKREPQSPHTKRMNSIPESIPQRDGVTVDLISSESESSDGGEYDSELEIIEEPKGIIFRPSQSPAKSQKSFNAIVKQEPLSSTRYKVKPMPKASTRSVKPITPVRNQKPGHGLPIAKSAAKLISPHATQVNTVMPYIEAPPILPPPKMIRSAGKPSPYIAKQLETPPVSSTASFSQSTSHSSASSTTSNASNSSINTQDAQAQIEIQIRREARLNRALAPKPRAAPTARSPEPPGQPDRKSLQAMAALVKEEALMFNRERESSRADRLESLKPKQNDTSIATSDAYYEHANNSDFEESSEDSSSSEDESAEAEDQQKVPSTLTLSKKSRASKTTDWKMLMRYFQVQKPAPQNVKKENHELCSRPQYRSSIYSQNFS